MLFLDGYSVNFLLTKGRQNCDRFYDFVRLIIIDLIPF